MDEHFDQAFHVFVEFKTSSGRQVDFLVLTKFGAYFLEEKGKPYREIKVNGHWLYWDSMTGNLVPESGEENP